MMRRSLHKDNLSEVSVFWPSSERRNLARSAKVAEMVYILPSVISFFFIFRIFLNNFSETNYLRIRWTDFRNLYIE